VPASARLQEFTFKAIGLGILFGIVFGAANAYLGLRAGLTISTSIPVAVMTVAVFRALEAAGRRGTILEANLRRPSARPPARWPAASSSRCRRCSCGDSRPRCCR
jgi:uncharacterized oligopeptide transporter (OPT) family protein